ncbi:MAG: hypothetical protein JO045_00290 [Mycobacterium sp.]|nr:hypothetical protein [Mycobacterium sp.]
MANSRNLPGAGAAFRLAIAAAAFVSLIASSVAGDDLSTRTPGSGSPSTDPPKQAAAAEQSAAGKAAETNAPQPSADTQERLKQHARICQARPEACVQQGEERSSEDRASGEDSRDGSAR